MRKNRFLDYSLEVREALHKRGELKYVVLVRYK